MDITSISDSWARLVTDGGQLWLTVGGPVHPRGVWWGQSQLLTLLTEKTISLQDWLWLGVLSNWNRLKETLEWRGWAQTMKAAIPHQTGGSMISYGLVRLRHIKWKRLGFGFKYLVLSQQTWRRKTRKILLKTSDFVATNVAWISVIVAGNCPCVASKPAVVTRLSTLVNVETLTSLSLFLTWPTTRPVDFRATANQMKISILKLRISVRLQIVGNI